MSGKADYAGFDPEPILVSALSGDPVDRASRLHLREWLDRRLLEGGPVTISEDTVRFLSLLLWEQM